MSAHDSASPASLETALARWLDLNPTCDGWGIAWYLAAGICTRFYVSHGVKPEVIAHEGLGYYGIALVQMGCFGNQPAALGRLTMAGNVENWTTGSAGDHGLELQPRVVAGERPDALLPEVIRHLGLTVYPQPSHRGCSHRRRGLSFELVFGLVAQIALRWEGAVQIWNSQDMTRDAALPLDPNPKKHRVPGYFLLNGPRTVVIAGDGRVLSPRELGSLWESYVAGAGLPALVAQVESALGLVE